MRYESTKDDWKKAVDSATDLIVAAGGDGTVAKVFTRVVGREIPVAVLALGTSNNIARALGLLGDARGMAASWDLERIGIFDVGVATIPANNKEMVFTEAFGGGVFAVSIKRGPQEVEKPRGFVGSEQDRALLMLKALVSELPPAHWEIKVDGADFSGDYVAVEAMNIRFAGPSIPLADRADPGDGLLDVAFVRDEDRGELIEYLDSRLAHQRHAPPQIEVLRGRDITLSSEDHLMHLDDDLVDAAGAVALTIRPGAVRYLQII